MEEAVEDAEVGGDGVEGVVTDLWRAGGYGGDWGGEGRGEGVLTFRTSKAAQSMAFRRMRMPRSHHV